MGFATLYPSYDFFQEFPMTTAPYPDGAGYVRGRFVPISEATLPVTDWGFTRSDVVYDVVHVFKGGFFRLNDHLDRFERSNRSR